MMEFFESYPFVKWILVGFGVLAILSKLFNFDPIDKLINRIGRYKFEEINHLEDEQLKRLIGFMREGKWSELTKSMRGFAPSYVSFGFRTLGQYAELKQINAWQTAEPENNLPKIVKAYHLVFQGWKIRGRGKIDTVSAKNLKEFKNHLHQAKEILLAIRKEAKFHVNVNALLLKIYMAIDVERQTIHDTYESVSATHPNHSELNFNYFNAITWKWGGTQEEVNAYLQTLETKSEFICNLISAQYYFDYVHMLDGADNELKMKSFLTEMKSFRIETNELYRYEFYLKLYWLANNLGYDDLESHFKAMVKPFCRD